MGRRDDTGYVVLDDQGDDVIRHADTIRRDVAMARRSLAEGTPEKYPGALASVRILDAEALLAENQRLREALERIVATDNWHAMDGHPKTIAENAGKGTPYRGDCGKCGARRVDQQLGLEPTPDEYVTSMVNVFREVRRVLRADGTLWLKTPLPVVRAGWRKGGPERTTLGFDPTCCCGMVSEGDRGAGPVPSETIPAVVLDPFLGSGTTAQVARRLGRKSIGIELNPEYAHLAARRLQQQSLFA